MKLYRETYDDGDTSLLTFDSESNNGNLIVTFVKSEFSDANKWKQKQVLTDIEVIRCQLSKIYCSADPLGGKLNKYIMDNFTKNCKIISDIVKISDRVDKINISLPTSTYSHKRGTPTSVRAFKNSFLPLLVDINGEDASRAFQDFDIFGSKAVDVAYDALINGKKPKTENIFVDFYLIGFLRNKIFGQSFVDEDVLSK